MDIGSSDAEPLLGAWRLVLDPALLTNIILPSFFLVGAALYRLFQRLPFTSWADTLLAIVAFDATVIVGQSEFAPLFSSSELAAHLTQIHLVFMILAAISWAGLVTRAEAVLARETRFNTTRSPVAWIATASGVTTAGMLIALHIYTYRVGAP
jgi:hypothetical protein